MRQDSAHDLARALFAEAGDALFLFDPDTDRLLDVNPMAERLSGFSRAELLDMQATYLFRAGMQGGRRRLREAAQKTGVFHAQDGFYLRNQQDGVWVPVNLTISRLHVQPKTLGLITARDVREQRETHARLQTMEAELRRVLASVSDCLWSATLDPAGRWTYRYLSPVVETITGRPPDYFREGVTRWRSIVHADDRPRWEAAFARLRQGRSGQEEYRIVGPDGGVRWVRDSVLVSPAKPGELFQLDGVLSDVTASRQAEEARHASEERLARVVETNPAAITIADRHRLITFANAAAETVLGLPRQQLLGRSLNDPVWKVTTTEGVPVPEDEQTFSRVIETGRPVQGIERGIRRPDGSWVIVTVNAGPLHDAGGQLVGVVSSLTDVTERKRAELMLQRRADEQESLLRVSGLLLHIASEEELYAEVPQTLRELFGFEIVAIQLYDGADGTVLFRGSTGVPPTESGPPRSPLAGSLAQMVLDSGEAVLVTDAQNCAEFADPVLRPLGVSTVLALPMVAPQPPAAADGKPRPTGVLLLASPRPRHLLPSLCTTLQTVADLIAQTLERKRAEQSLRSSEERYRLLFERNLAGVFRSSPDGRLLDCNDSFARILGYAGREEVLAHPAWDFYCEPADREALLGQLRARQTLTGYECRLRRPDGSLAWVLENVTLLDGEGGEPMLEGTIFDVTERKRLEEELRQAQKMDAIGKLAGGIAHDFNNLLTAILGNVSLVLAGLPADDPSSEALQATEKAALRAAELTRQLLGFSRQTMLRLEWVQLSQAVQETVKILRRTIDPRIAIEVRTAADLWKVRADPAQVTQVLMNLCLNARDAMPEGGRLLIETDNAVLNPGDVHHLDARPGEFVRLRVSDTGAGIPPEIRPRIFDPFFTTKGPGRGTGLGLSMVFGIVKQHQGWIECYSEPGQGTRFDVYLPRGAVEAPVVTPAAPAKLPSGGSETILLADDEAMLRSLGLNILRQYGYRVLLAGDGLEAVEIFERERGRIDLVILDLTMPRMNGRDALRRILEIDPEARVVFASGYSPESLTEWEDRHILGFIGKPFRINELARTVRAALDRPIACSLDMVSNHGERGREPPEEPAQGAHAPARQRK